jgi:hypothetical protein
MEAVKKETGQIKTLENTSAASIEILNQLVDSLLTCTQSQIESVREQSVLVLKRYTRRFI